MLKKQKLTIQLQKSGSWAEVNGKDLHEKNINVSTFSQRSGSAGWFSSKCLLVLTPQMSHLSLNTDTFPLSGQSTLWIVLPCPPAGSCQTQGRQADKQSSGRQCLGCTDLDSPRGAGRIVWAQVGVEHWLRRGSWQAPSHCSASWNLPQKWTVWP